MVAFFTVFFHGNFRSEEASDVISSVAVDGSVWMSLSNLVLLGQTVLEEIYERLTL